MKVIIFFPIFHCFLHTFFISNLTFYHIYVREEICSFYVRKQLLLSERLSHHNSVCLSVHHTGGSVKNAAS